MWHCALSGLQSKTIQSFSGCKITNSLEKPSYPFRFAVTKCSYSLWIRNSSGCYFAHKLSKCRIFSPAKGVIPVNFPHDVFEVNSPGYPPNFLNDLPIHYLCRRKIEGILISPPRVCFFFFFFSLIFQSTDPPPPPLWWGFLSVFFFVSWCPREQPLECLSHDVQGPRVFGSVSF